MGRMVTMATRREETDLRLLRAVLVFVGVSVLCCGVAGARGMDGPLERRAHKHRHTAGKLIHIVKCISFSMSSIQR